MEDRYLFKARRLNNGEWVQGYLYGIWEKRYILWGMTNDIPAMIEVNPSTICQCTGLRDENGKLIWENDIIKCRLGKTIVLWDEAEWKIKKHDGFIWYKDLYYWVISARNAEVIGNIFDNPELLESIEKGGAEDDD